MLKYFDQDTLHHKYRNNKSPVIRYILTAIFHKNGSMSKQHRLLLSFDGKQLLKNLLHGFCCHQPHCDYYRLCWYCLVHQYINQLKRNTDQQICAQGHHNGIWIHFLCSGILWINFHPLVTKCNLIPYSKRENLKC